MLICVVVISFVCVSFDWRVSGCCCLLVPFSLCAFRRVQVAILTLTLRLLVVYYLFGFDLCCW